MEHSSLTDRILGAYNLPYSQVLPVQKGYRNETYGVRLTNGRLVNLILYKSEAGILAKIRTAHRVSEHLARQGLLVRHPYDTRVMKIQAGKHIKYAALYNYLPGKTIPWEAYTQEHIKLLGGELSNLHAALQNLPREDGPSVSDEYLVLCQKMQRYFSEPGVSKALQTKLGLTISPQVCDPLLQLLRLAHGLPNQQWLHMDFVRGNVLFAQRQISGILDFEKASWGHPLFDVARTLAFLLVDCKYKTADQVRKYFLQSGYNKRGQTIFKNIKLKTDAGTVNVLETLINLFLCYDLYKFLRHNPYESLSQNEHFIRTKDCLIERKVIC